MDKYVKIGNFDGFDTKFIYWSDPSPKDGWQKKVGAIRKRLSECEGYVYDLFAEIEDSQPVFISTHETLSDVQQEAKFLFSSTELLLKGINVAISGFKSEILSIKTGNKEVK